MIDLRTEQLRLCVSPCYASRVGKSDANEAASAMSAGTAATTGIGAGRQPASAVAESETPNPNISRTPKGGEA